MARYWGCGSGVVVGIVSRSEELLVSDDHVTNSLCGVCMFSQRLHGFSLDAQASSHSLNTDVRLNVDSKLPLDLNVNGIALNKLVYENLGLLAP